MDISKEQNHVISGKNYEKEINVRELFIIIKKRLWVVLLLAAVFTAFGYYYVSLPRTPLYEASTRIYLDPKSDRSSNLKVMIREPIVLDEVVKLLDLNRSAESLRGQISAGFVEDSSVLRISVVDASQELAARIANTIVQAYELVSSNTVYYTSLTVLTRAEVLEYPVPINPQSNNAIWYGLAAGMIIGIGLVFLLDSLDDSFRSERDIERLLGLNVLGQVSKIKKRDLAKLSSKQRELTLRGESVGS